MAPAIDDTVIAVVPMNANDARDDAVSTNGVISRHQDAPVGRETNNECTNNTNHEATSTEAENMLMQTLLHEAKDGRPPVAGAGVATFNADSSVRQFALVLCCTALSFDGHWIF